MTSKRLEKEAFVTNLNGCGIVEVVLLELILSIVYYITRAIQIRWKTFYVLEFCIFVIPVLISMTVGSNYLVLFLSFLIGVALVLHSSKSSTVSDPIPKKQETYFVSIRASLQILTCIAILAVDFHVFPRRYAKTELFGFSLMDFGAGGFIYTSAFVAGGRIHNYQQGKLKDLIKTFKIALPSLLLGLSRLISTKLVDYQVFLRFTDFRNMSRNMECIGIFL